MSDRLLHQDWVMLWREPRAVSRIATVTDWLRAAWRRQRSRHNIAGLDAHHLQDIGVSFAEAEAEANKPFWQA